MAEYKKFLENSSYEKCSLVMPADLSDLCGIENDEEVSLIKSEDLIPKLMGYKGRVTDYSRYNLILILNTNRYKYFRRKFLC